MKLYHRYHSCDSGQVSRLELPTAQKQNEKIKPGKP